MFGEYKFKTNKGDEITLKITMSVISTFDSIDMGFLKYIDNMRQNYSLTAALDLVKEASVNKNVNFEKLIENGDITPVEIIIEAYNAGMAAMFPDAGKKIPADDTADEGNSEKKP